MKVGDLVAVDEHRLIEDMKSEIGVVLWIDVGFYRPWTMDHKYPNVQDRIKVYWLESKTISYEPNTFLRVLTNETEDWNESETNSQ